MIPKINRGNGFRGVLDYALKKEKGHLIGGNMIGENPRELAMEFGITRNLDESIKNPVWHCSLALNPGEELNDDQWRKITSEYMKDLGFTENHQFCVVKHEDTDHSHVHIIASRIGGNFELYKGHRDGLKAGAVCSKIELEYDLNLVDRRRSHKKHLDKNVLSQLDQKLGNTPKKANEDLVLSKNQRELEKRTGIKSAERKAFEALQEVLKKGKDLKLKDLVLELAAEGVYTQIKRYEKSGKVQGLSFEVDDYAFKASKLKNSWSKIKTKINYNEQEDLKKYKEIQDGISRVRETGRSRTDVEESTRGITEDIQVRTQKERRELGGTERHTPGRSESLENQTGSIGERKQGTQQEVRSSEPIHQDSENQGGRGFKSLGNSPEASERQRKINLRKSSGRSTEPTRCLLKRAKRTEPIDRPTLGEFRPLVGQVKTLYERGRRENPRVAESIGSFRETAKRGFNEIEDGLKELQKRALDFRAIKKLMVDRYTSYLNSLKQKVKGLFDGVTFKKLGKSQRKKLKTSPVRTDMFDVQFKPTPLPELHVCPHQEKVREYQKQQEKEQRKITFDSIRVKNNVQEEKSMGMGFGGR